MNIVINTTAFSQFLSLAPGQMLWVFWRDIGWLIISFIYLYGVRETYLLWLRRKWSLTHQNVLLAIDVPRGNEQSPKAVENIFAYLGGAQGSINFFEKWFEGKYQKSFSFEIVSLEGYTQFLIRTPLEFRNLVESAVYSQYPDAEISEVDDYIDKVPQNYPNDEYDLWGSEFIHVKSWVYPIKCYNEFEHQIGPSEMQFKDPMASLMDLCGSLHKGEQLWLQLIIIPTGFDWVKKCDHEINKILERPEKKKEGLSNSIIKWLGELSELVYSIWGDIETTEQKSRTMLDLTPAEKRQVENIQIKSSKIAFETKIRAIYVARKEVMDKTKVVGGLVGFMKQFAALDLNNIKPDVGHTFTKAVYFFTKYRLNTKKRRIFQAYINRSDSCGRKPGIYNIEELATLWHFPIAANVKAAMIQEASGRKANAPIDLPLASASKNIVPDIFNGDLSNSSSKIIKGEQLETSSKNISTDDEVSKNNKQGESLFRQPSQSKLDVKDINSNIPSNLPFV